MNLPFFNWIKNIFRFNPIIKDEPPKIIIPPTVKPKPMAKDEITIKRIKKSHPKIRTQLEKDYIECNNKVLGKYVRLRFAQVYRTIKEQDELYAQGRTKPGKKVTNAKGGQSIHNYGLAFDIVLLYDKDKNGTFETASWELNSDWYKVVDFFKKKGYSWGGDWKSFKDNPHFEKTFGETWRTLIKKNKDSEGYPIL